MIFGIFADPTKSSVGWTLVADGLKMADQQKYGINLTWKTGRNPMSFDDLRCDAV